jgi:hypothetical protein
MPQRTRTAPYKPGDRVRALLMDRRGSTCLAVVTLDRVTPLSDGRSWRIGGTRPGDPHLDPTRDCPRVEWVVDATGCDVNRYVERYVERRSVPRSPR